MEAQLACCHFTPSTFLFLPFLLLHCRQFLADLAEAQQRGACWDARRHTLDLVSLPDGGRWLGGAQLLVSDLQYILLYDRALALLGALAFTDRPVRGG